MAMSIRSVKDLGAGALYVGLGAAAVLIARDYTMGTASRMGPGYFPTVLGGLLVLFGIASFVRAFLVPGEPIGAIAWRALLFVTLAVVAFAALLDGAGLVPALVALIAISTLASRERSFGWRGLAAAAALIAFCAFVFVRELGLPMPLFGPWLGG